MISFRNKTKKFMLFCIILTYICFAVACRSNNNDSNQGSGDMAGTENTVSPSPLPDKNNDISGSDNVNGNNDLSGNDNIINDAGNAAGDIVDGIGNGVEDVIDGVGNAADDIVNGTDTNDTNTNNVNGVTEGTR